MGTPLNRMWRLAARPVGDIKDEDLAWHEEPAREPADGEVLVRTEWLALDPTHRVWMSELPQPLPPVRVGEVMRGAAMGTVVASRSPRVAVGATVSGTLGWQSHPTVKASTLFVHAPELPFSVDDYLGAVNEVGATAWFGVNDVARPGKDETFVVSAAAGAVGSLAGQLAKRRGARVIGIASTPAKVAWLTDTLGFDAVIDRAAEDVAPGLDRLCPKGIDSVFDNVGGPILDACLGRLRRRARVALCGSTSTYNAIGRVPGPSNFGKILERAARVEGFSVLDYVERWGEAFAEIGSLVTGKDLKYRLDIIEGLPNAVVGLRRLFSGENMGRMVIKI